MAQLLPQELIIEIFHWLPVKSILRFRCVSKLLREVIDSPNFINSHLSKSSHTFNPRKLIFRPGNVNDFNLYVCDVNVDLEEEILLRALKPFSFLCEGYCMGYSNGLLLFYGPKLQLALLNPSTRQFKYLPVCPCEVLPVHSYHFIASGLGYDDSVDDYKALLVVYVREKLEFEIQVWIFGFKSNIWGRSQNFPYPVGVYMGGKGYFADGSLHFLFEHNELKSKIVVFDMRKETFSLVPQPVCSVNGAVVDSKLHVLGGCLCVSYFSHSTPAQADLYMRKKDGIDHFTWIKLFSITDPVYVGGVKDTITHWLDCIVLGYAKGGDKILLNLSVSKVKRTKLYMWFHMILKKKVL